MRKLFGGVKVVILKIMGVKVVISVFPGGRLDICRGFNYETAELNQARKDFPASYCFLILHLEGLAAMV